MTTPLPPLPVLPEDYEVGDPDHTTAHNLIARAFNQLGQRMAQAIAADTTLSAALQTMVGAQLGAKADASTVTTLSTVVAGKAAATDLTALATVVSSKADAGAVSTALGTKADATAVTTALGNKADAATTTTALAAKADAAATTTALAGKAQVLTITAVKTSAYTAAAGNMVPVDTTNGTVPVTLPAGPGSNSRVVVKLVAGTNPVNIVLGGSDHINTSTGPTTATLTLVNQSLQFQYESTTAIWYVVANDLPLLQLDGRFVAKPTSPAANPNTSGAALVDLETEVNELKATLRAAGLIAP